jgi:phage repressor protein C with HTH and peptisase S24 domain
MDTLLERISQLAAAENITIGALEKRIGASKGVISRAVRGNTDIQAKWICKIVEIYPQYSTDWLLTGRGEILKDVQNVSAKEDFSLPTDRHVSSQDVPLYALDAAAGLVAIFNSTCVEPADYLRIPNLPPVDGALYVRGESMSPLLKSGDIVIFKKKPLSMDSIIWGEIYILSFNLDGDTYTSVKYVRKSDTPGFVRLVSYNPDFAPKDIPLSSITALALVKASLTFHTMD